MTQYLKGRRLTFFVYFLISLSIAVSLWFIFREKPIVVERTQILKGNFQEKIVLDGRIRSKNKITLVAFASGDIDEIKLKKGDIVKKGEMITMLHWDIHKSLVSPIDGVVTALHRTSPGPVNRGDHLLDLVDTSNLEIVAEPLTSEALKISQGNEVEIQGLRDGQTFLGEVFHVSRAGYVKISALGVEEERTEIRIKMKDVPSQIVERLGEEFHVEISVKVFEKPNVLKVPLGALFKDKDQWSVFKINAGRAQIQKVEIAQRNNREAILLSGLSEGDEVILFPSDVVRDQVKVESF